MRNREILDRALEELRKGLRPFVVRELKVLHGSNWQAIVEQYLPRHAPSMPATSDDDIPLDVNALLRVITDRWNEFREKLDHKARGYVSELRAIRNEFAHPSHGEGFSTQDTDRALDTIARLLNLVSAATEEETVQHLRRQVGKPTAPPGQRKPSGVSRVRPMPIAALKPDEVVEAVRAFDDRYGEMEKVLWRLSKAAREDLLRGRSSTIVEALVWTIKSWWSVQGVTAQIKTAAAQALASQGWTEKLFDDTAEFTPEAETFARERVSSLVSSLQALGATTRQEFSLASKALHWLLPWRVPVYDSLVRASLSIPSTKPANEAYSTIVRGEYALAQRLLAMSSDWMGTIEPRSPFRAIDKYLWWLAGGPSQQAVIAKDPRKVLRELGMTPG